MELIGLVEFSGCSLFFFSSRRRHTRYWRDWSSDVCSSDLGTIAKQTVGCSPPCCCCKTCCPSARRVAAISPTLRLLLLECQGHGGDEAALAGEGEDTHLLGHRASDLAERHALRRLRVGHDDRPPGLAARSGEGRVGKEGRSRLSPAH